MLTQRFADCRIALFANTDWYLYNFRLPLAEALRREGADVLLIAPPGPYAARLTDHGFRFIPFAFHRLSLNPLQQASAVARLTGVYRRESPNLVHHFTIKCAAYGSLAARAAGGIAVVNAFAGFGSVFARDASRFQGTRRIVLGTLRLALAGTDVIVQNPDDQALLTESGLAPPGRVRLIRGSGVNLDRFHPVDRSGRGTLRVLLASRLLRSKGIEVFETVAARLRGRVDAEFLLAGAPDEGNPDSLRRWELDALAARGNIRLLGHIDDMPALLAAADLVVLPTTYGEGVPRILIEAAAAGLPLVATDVPGCREIVREGDNGRLIKAGDIDALTAAIERILTDAAARAAMGAASRGIAVDFSETRVIADTVQVYAYALGALKGAHVTIAPNRSKLRHPISRKS